MPTHEEHCQDSLRRYGKTFSELHRWMDEPSAIIGSKHRMYRHDPYTTPQEARLLFGSLADQACLDHIRLDQLESRREGIRRTREPQISVPLAFGFLSLINFIIGLIIIISTSHLIIRLVAFMWFFLSFLCFIRALSATSGKKGIGWRGETYKVEIDKLEMKVLRTCPNCGTSYEDQLEKCPKCGT